MSQGDLKCGECLKSLGRIHPRVNRYGDFSRPGSVLGCWRTFGGDKNGEFASLVTEYVFVRGGEEIDLSRLSGLKKAFK